MKKRTNKLYVLLSLSLLSLILLVGCSASDSSQDVADDTATRQEDTGSHTSLEQGIELNSDGTGCYSQEISVGENEIFVLGDNRVNSLDSRELGCFKIEDVLSKKGIILFPFNHMKGMN